MAQYKVLQVFKDKHTGNVYKVGEEVEMTVKRANEATANLEKWGGGFLERVDKKDDT